MVNEQYWRQRAREYSRLQWAADENYKNAILDAADLQPNNMVLDAGTGTGIIARAVAPLVKHVVALDSSATMLAKFGSDGAIPANISTTCEDIRKTSFADASFDRIISRMMFHYLLEGIEESAAECYRLLKPAGLMVLAEGVPPIPALKADYEAIFELKEQRRTFLEEDLVALLEGAGFTDVRVRINWIRSMSVRNWLSRSGNVSSEVQEQIVQLHVNGSETFKRAYNLEIVDNDCFIDIKNAIVVGVRA